MTEVARSVFIRPVESLAEYEDPQEQPYTRKRPTGVKQHHDKLEEQKMFRLFLGASQSSSFDWPRLDRAKVVRSIRYGLINVRTDGERLFFAQMEERGNDWAVLTLSAAQIDAAR
jgi:hypothetical protein